jgi:NAD(P)H-dependent FMN reductase
MINIKIILGSIRDGRFGDKPTKWLSDIAVSNKDLSIEVLDLKDYELPIFKEAVSPAYVVGEYSNNEVNTWAKKISEADAFIVVTPEYNHGYPSSLKNNIDYLYKEWNNKPIAFVGYGSAGGARAIQQLRQVAIELQMAPIRNSVHIMNPWFMTEEDGSLKAGVLDPYVKNAEGMIAQLVWWAKALKIARDNK